MEWQSGQVVDPAAEVPSPRLVAAQWVLGSLAVERVPWWAAHWLAEGQDGQALRELAGLSGADIREVSDLVPDALAEMSVEIPSTVAAAATLDFDHFARMLLSDRASERWVAQKVEETLDFSGYDPAVLELPLGRLHGVEDAWAGGWGPPEDALRAQVRAACVQQLSR